MYAGFYKYLLKKKNWRILAQALKYVHYVQKNYLQLYNLNYCRIEHNNVNLNTHLRLKTSIDVIRVN